MRTPVSLALLLLLPSVSLAQTREIEDAIQTKISALKFVYALEDPAGGFKPDPEGKVGLRATSAAARAIKYLGGKVPNTDKHAAFVLKCFDPNTGGFADTPGGKPDVTVTSIGVMAAVELGVPKEKFAKAMDYLKANAKTFEEVRIGAAAVEAWGVKDSPFDLEPWFEIADKFARMKAPEPPGSGARDAGSFAAFRLRLGKELPDRKAVLETLKAGQREDGGWARPDGKGSELETTYRVMRAFMLLKEKPKDPAKLREFIGKCRNADGGFGVQPGAKSSVSGVYYYAIITKWLDELEGK
ncbi:MAG TPA: prenyltransferase/squalene oxidase repeat-containing protein [Gemmataceae bacterium]|nr:prenyltransferase/squalene oxidase repeat-containing protein [Gemmataceae bacterium]